MRWPWELSDYARGAQVATDTDILAVLKSLAPDAHVDDEYEHFLLLGYPQVKALVAKYWDASGISYGSIKPDWPLCYDYAELCAAAVRRGAIQERLPYRPAFGTLRYTLSDNRHAICFTVTAECQVKYFEPQMTGVRWMDAPRDVQSLVNFDI